MCSVNLGEGEMITHRIVENKRINLAYLELGDCSHSWDFEALSDGWCAL